MNDEEHKLLKKCLRFLRKERNNWAHGHIHFEEEIQGGNRFFQPYLVFIDYNGLEKGVR